MEYVIAEMQGRWYLWRVVQGECAECGQRRYELAAVAWFWNADDAHVFADWLKLPREVETCPLTTTS